MNRFYLGLSTSGHDPSLALVNEAGRVLFAEATERFLQDKRAWGAVPDHSGHLARALRIAGVPGDAEFVVARTWKDVKDHGATEVMDTLLPASEGAWLRGLQKRAHTGAGESLARHLGQTALPDLRQYEHHLCHAAFAAYSAPFSDAVCLVLDGEGDVGAVSLYRFSSGRLKRLWRSWGPGSLGSFYGWLTGACGFDWRAGEEWKVMGLAAFGKPQTEMMERMRRMLLVENGRLLLPEGEVLLQALSAMTRWARRSGEPLMQAADLAASGQEVYAEFADAVLAACTKYGTRNLILSGGCALNSSYNGTILGRLEFDNVHVPCAPADDGNAVGAALLAWMEDHPGEPLPQAHAGQAGSPFLGNTVGVREIVAAAQNYGAARVTELGAAAPRNLAQILADGKIVGVMRGRAEFGPRALGHRSILADPRPADMKDRLNRRVKGREPYRPFAPMVPAELTADWFHKAQPSPYMSFTLPWREDRQSLVPAVVHEDGTGRLQTVEAGADPWLHDLLTAFGVETGVPILLNTSFNVMGKPIVDTVQDAVAVLATTGLDAVLLEDILIEKIAP